MSVLVGGYGIAWGSTGEWFDNGREQVICPNSITVDSAHGARLIAFGHDDELPTVAATNDDSMAIWADAWGLAFFAQIAPEDSAGLNAALRADVNFASVGLNGTETEVRSDGREYLIAARLEHIALVCDPFWDGTSAFVVDADLETLPGEIRQLRAKWGESFVAYRAGRIASAVTKPAAPRPVQAPKVTADPVDPLPQFRQIPPERARTAIRARISRHPRFEQMLKAYEAANAARGIQ